MNDAQPVRPRVVAHDEGEALWFFGNLVTVKASASDTGGRVSVVEFLNPPGFAPPLRRHLREDELFPRPGRRGHVLLRRRRTARPAG